MTAPPIIQAQSLTKFYGRDVGVEHVDFTVEQDLPAARQSRTGDQGSHGYGVFSAG